MQDGWHPVVLCRFRRCDNVCASRHPPRPLGCSEARMRRCLPSRPRAPLKYFVTLHGHRRTRTHDHAWTFAYTTISPNATTTAIGGMASKILWHAAWLSGCVWAQMRQTKTKMPTWNTMSVYVGVHLGSILAHFRFFLSHVGNLSQISIGTCLVSHAPQGAPLNAQGCHLVELLGHISAIFGYTFGAKMTPETVRTNCDF